MSDASFDETMIVPKLEPPPTRKLAVQFAARRQTARLWPWLVGATVLSIVIAIGVLRPFSASQRQLELESSAQAVLRSLGQ